METDPPPNITSFVIRFIHPDLAIHPGKGEFRGAIRHIQTDEEISFTRWEDALAFMKRFVPIGWEADE
jgi:hypothetical protein